MLQRLLMGLITGLLSTAASAQAFVGLGLGPLDLDSKGFENPTAFELSVGSTVNRYLAIEASYTDFGEADDDIPPVWTLSGDSLGFGVRLTVPLTEGFDIYGRLGMHAWTLNLDQDGLGRIAEDDGTDKLYGLGLATHLPRGFRLGVRYTRLDIDEEQFTMLSGNLEYRF